MLTLRKTWPGEPKYQDDYEVLEDGLPIGRIYLSNATTVPQWLWFVQIHIPRHDHSGRSTSFDDAKEAFRRRWEALKATYSPEEWAKEVERLKKQEGTRAERRA